LFSIFFLKRILYGDAKLVKKKLSVLAINLVADKTNHIANSSFFIRQIVLLSKKFFPEACDFLVGCRLKIFVFTQDKLYSYQKNCPQKHVVSKATFKTGAWFVVRVFAR